MATTVIHIKDAPTGWKTNEQYVYIGRGSKWGNPFKIGGKDLTKPLMDRPPMDRDRVCDLYTIWAGSNQAIQTGIHTGELRDKILVCYCYPQRCHGNVLASWSNALFENLGE